ncbi:MAG TPA: DUF1080 domain-containing protein [Pirellulales bacterium]|nr:DUF1080 domain-containing protein [Pirellulales bacterium]
MVLSSRGLKSCLVACVAAGLAGWLVAEEYQSGRIWPEPKAVTPGENGAPPSDALVLFDGHDLSQWQGGEKWLIEKGVATAKGGTITSKQAFGSCQLHVEWAAPAEVKGTGQGRGNSGIYLQSHYEVQVLDSYDNQTYFDGQAGSIYKQWPPLVNACRKPGEWQSYDILFDAPKFDATGKLLRPGYVTVLHNGVVVQNHSELLGTTAWDRAPAYEPHPEKLPLQIQDHGNPVRFRNIWIRELADRPEPQVASAAVSRSP